MLGLVVNPSQLEPLKMAQAIWIFFWEPKNFLGLILAMGFQHSFAAFMVSFRLVQVNPSSDASNRPTYRRKKNRPRTVQEICHMMAAKKIDHIWLYGHLII